MSAPTRHRLRGIHPRLLVAVVAVTLMLSVLSIVGSPSPAPAAPATAAAAIRDRVAPKIRVKAPQRNRTFRGPTVVLRGVAKDNLGVTAVYARVRDRASKRWLRADGAWVRRPVRLKMKLRAPGSSTSKWSRRLRLPAGSYRLQIIARDAARNRSRKPRARFTVKPAVGQPAARVVLTPTTTPQRSQSFSWLGGRRAAERLQIRPSAGGSVRTISASARGSVNGNPRQRFSTTAAGLSPATKYDYRVGLPGSWSAWHTFGTAGSADDKFTFLYFGDAQVGLGSTWRRVVQAAEAKAPEAAGSIHAGDLINNADNDSQWRDWFAGMAHAAATSNVLAAPGNHEYLGDRLLTAWKATFEYPRNQPTRATIGSLADRAVGSDQVARQYASYFNHFAVLAAETVYYTDYQGVRFVTLNTTREQEFLRPDDLPACWDPACPSSGPGDLWIKFQAAWLEGVLAQNPGKWSVVSFHQPVYSSSVGRDEAKVREHLVPVFESYGVDLVLMGHDHVYSRGYKDTSATSTPGRTSGPVYVVSDAGAQYFPLETDPKKNVWTTNGATQVRTGQGVTTYQTVDVTGSTLHYRSWLVEKGRTATTNLPEGALFDEFTVTRRANGQTWVTEPGVVAPR